jgi:hypothetical protein
VGTSGPGRDKIRLHKHCKINFLKGKHKEGIGVCGDIWNRERGNKTIIKEPPKTVTFYKHSVCKSCTSELMIVV